MRRIFGRLTVLVIGISLIAFLCGFCDVHDWAPATCDEAETCRICGQVRGTPLGHQWGELQGIPSQTIIEENDFCSRTCKICGAILHPIESGNWFYRLLDDGTAELVHYGSKRQNLEIPQYIDGIKVTSLGEKLLYDEYAVVAKLVIPEGITTIGENAFTLCEGLCSLDLPSTLTTIIGNPFSKRDAKKITVSPDNPNFEVVDGVLFEKNDRRMIYRPDFFTEDTYAVPEGTLEIGSKAFLGQNECILKSIILPDGLKKIDDYAFGGCYQLEGIDIPEGVTSIGYQILPPSGEMRTITIPSSVSEMNGNPFNCGMEVLLSSDNPYYKIINGVLFDTR